MDRAFPRIEKNKSYILSLIFNVMADRSGLDAIWLTLVCTRRIFLMSDNLCGTHEPGRNLLLVFVQCIPFSHMAQQRNNSVIREPGPRVFPGASSRRPETHKRPRFRRRVKFESRQNKAPKDHFILSRRFHSSLRKHSRDIHFYIRVDKSLWTSFRISEGWWLCSVRRETRLLSMNCWGKQSSLQDRAFRCIISWTDSNISQI